jgi:hypothetical protein
MVAHIYPSVLQALAGRGRTERLEGEIAGDRGEDIQDLGYELPRIPIPRTWVNKPFEQVKRRRPQGIASSPRGAQISIGRT